MNELMQALADAQNAEDEAHEALCAYADDVRHTHIIEKYQELDKHYKLLKKTKMDAYYKVDVDEIINNISLASE